MKIMLVGAESEITSGAFRCLAEMTKYLIERKNEVIVVLPKNGTGESLLKEYGANYRIIENHGIVGKDNLKSRLKFFVKHTLNMLKAKKKIYQLLLTEKPDIVHINSAFTYFFAYCAEKLKVAYTWHLRDLLEEGHNCTWENKKLAINLINNSKKIITVSDFVYDKYKNILDQSKMVRVYDGIDIDKFYQEKKIFIGPNKKLLFVGGVCKNKGQLEIVEVLSEMKNAGIIDNFDMKIAGGGDAEYINELKNIIINNHMENYIHYIGKCEKIEDLYKDSDIVFVNSYAEAFGRITVEGMASGCLVIGANCGGTKEILSGECGILYEYGNKEAIKNAIIKAFSQKDEMQIIAKRGQEKAKLMFDSKQNAQIMNDMFMNEVNKK